MKDSSKLTALQDALLHAFFQREQRFFLTGGGALAAFYLHHRTTDDLDLFATSDVPMADGIRALRAGAEAISASVEALIDSQDFRRFSVTRGGETTLVDLVIDRVPQIIAEKPEMDGIRVDPAREIAANKLCTIINRCAPRDLVDLKLLLDSGFELAQVLADAQTKDAAADPGTLAWLLNDLRIQPGVALPGGVTTDEIETFRQRLISEFAKMAIPR